MKTFTVIASQLIFYKKTIAAESEEEAERIAIEDDTGQNWKEFHYGDWQLEEIKEVNE